MQKVEYRKFFESALTIRKYTSTTQVVDVLLEYELLLKYRWLVSKTTNDNYWFLLNKFHQLTDDYKDLHAVDNNTLRSLVVDLRSAIYVNYPTRHDRTSCIVIRDTLKLINILEAALYSLLLVK